MPTVIDMETRSEVLLPKCGVYRYAEDLSTDVLCVAVKVDDAETSLWINRAVIKLPSDSTHLRILTDEELDTIMSQSGVLVAHNAAFERILWRDVMVDRYGFGSIPFSRWKCTAAKAAALSLPRSLDGVCSALGLSPQKDDKGHRLMLKMCKPRKPSKNNPAKWFDSPEEFLRLCEYCISDVDAEHELDNTIRDLSDDEQQVWLLDQKINDRGIPVDVQSIDALIHKIGERESNLLQEISTLTEGYVISPRQTQKSKKWLLTKGVKIPDLTKETVKTTLERDLPTPAKRFLEIRQSLSKSSVGKLAAMRRRVSADGYVRGTLLYHAASTGRWGGKGIQPHNYPRDSFDEQTVDELYYLTTEEIDAKYGCTFIAASKSLRGMIQATPWSRFLCADFSAIEARVLAWLANEESVLEDFRNGLDPYKVAASDVFGVPYEDISSAQRFVGKTIVLACGYQGWVNAFRKMANDEVNLLSDKQIANHIAAWRKSRIKTTYLWAGLENAAIQAVKHKKMFQCGRVFFTVQEGFLYCRLPSGRLIAYYNPVLVHGKDPWGRSKTTIHFKAVNSISRKWGNASTYGGKLTENIVQAIARDLLVYSMQECEKEGYHINLHVHDEAAPEVYGDQYSLEEFKMLMSRTPGWAEGLPLACSGWEGRRYRKE